MSNLINKAKDALSGHKQHETTTTTTVTTSVPRNGVGPSPAGQPNQGGIGQKVNPLVDSDNDHRNNPSSHIGGYGQTQGTTGAYGTDGTQAGYGQPTTIHTSGGLAGTASHHDPSKVHNSNVLNTLDPRVDDTRVAGTHGTSGTPGTQPGYGTHGTQAGYGQPTTTHTSGGLAGAASHHDPSKVHNSNILNTLDPRVDDTRVAGTHGASGTHGTQAGYGQPTTTHTSGGLAGTGSYHDPSKVHNSNILNTLDPRVDDTRVAGTHGASGIAATHGTHGGVGPSPAGQPNQGRIGQKLNPLVDSDNDGRNNPASHVGGLGQTQGTTGGTTSGGYGPSGVGATGTQQGYNNPQSTRTAGPHNSDLMNRLDVRVDSDRDGSATVGNKQY